MDSIEQPQLLQLMQHRRDLIADRWYAAIAPISFTPLDAAEVRAELVAMTELAITALLSVPFDSTTAHFIGEGLARLHSVHHGTLGKTLQVLAEQLMADLSAAHVLMLQPRLAILLSELAAGFFRQAHSTILKGQQEIRAALLAEHTEVVAALRMCEERLHMILTIVPLILFVTDQTDVITLVEGKGLQALEIRPSELVGQPVADVVSALPSADVPGILEHFRRALAGEAFTIIGKVGELVFETHYAPLRNQQDSIIGVIGVAIDVTERTQVEAALDVAQRQLAKSVGLGLTDREMAVLQDIVWGKTDYEISQELHISPRTVRTDVHSICHKLGVKKRAQAIVRAIQLGLVNA